eukprot:3104767-Pleurochrysis_carterae.AAC.1
MAESGNCRLLMGHAERRGLKDGPTYQKGISMCSSGRTARQRLGRNVSSWRRTRGWKRGSGEQRNRVT